MMKKNQLTYTQLEWIVLALQHHMAEVRNEMDSASDGSPIQSLGEIFLEGRQNLVTTLTDMMYKKAKTISLY